MSLYESLDGFVGAGIWALAVASVRGAHGNAHADGAELSAFLRSRGEGGPIGDILDRLAHQVWVSQDTRGIPMHVAAEHAHKLAAVLVRVSPDPGAGSVTSGGMSGAITQWTERVLQAAAGSPAADGISPDVAQFLLEQLFHQLLSEPGLIPKLAPGIAAYAARSPGAHPEHQEQIEPSGTLAAVPRSDIAALQERYGLSDKVMARFSAVAEKRRAASPAFGSEPIAELAEWLQQARAQLVRPSNESAGVRDLKARAAKALTAGEFEAAMDLLKEVRRRLRDERRRTEQRLEEELGLLRTQLHQEAIAVADLAELAMARCAFAEAAELFEEAADGIAASDAKARLRFDLRRGDALCYAGEESANPETLRLAVRVYASVAEAAGIAGDAASLAAASRGLGNALLAIADHQPSKVLYEQASVAFRTTLDVLTRESDPRMWALARMGLGNALASMCELESASAVTLEQAAVAYKGALEVLTRESDPMRWALTRLNMATVLIRLGDIKDRRANWLAAAAAIVPAIETFETLGAMEQADAARQSLRMLHSRWDRLEPPEAAE